MTNFSHTGFSARVLADSVSPKGVRLTTLEATFPRPILSEVNTHRALSRNSASSRAIPVIKQIRKLLAHPFVPSKIGINQSGMQASRFLEGEELRKAQENVILKRDRAVIGALEDLAGREYVTKAFGSELPNIFANGFDDKALAVVDAILAHYGKVIEAQKLVSGFETPDGFLNIHKQTLNRYLEPFMWHTAVISATDWDNFYALRIHENAQPEIDEIARLMKEAMDASTPTLLNYGEWHLPFVQDEEKATIDDENIEAWKKISSGRTARVSYETHNGTRDTVKDTELSTGLENDGHMSPFEHVATPVEDDGYIGNFKGWLQMRKTIKFEDNYGAKLRSLIQ